MFEIWETRGRKRGIRGEQVWSMKGSIDSDSEIRDYSVADPQDRIRGW